MRATLQTGWRRAAAALFACMLALACGAARADTAIGLFKSFAGNVNFVGTQQTMRTKANAKDPCAVMPANAQLSANLAGIPDTATVLSAQLYWAGSSSSADNSVSFDGQAVTAPVARRYFSHTIGSGFDYFGGAADVTAQVVAKRNATYKFSDLTIMNGAPYCSAEGVLGGFALLVVYSDTAEPFRVLNVYEGFQFMRYSALTLTLGNFRTPSPLGSATGRIGHITWEGDQSLGASGEDLLFNGVEMSDTLNPAHNQFNSASNINNDSASYGIDFDAYTVGSNALAAGQTSATSTYQAGQDMVLLNAEIIAVPNVPTADLSISMKRNSNLVQLQNATYTLSVSNGGPKDETGPVVVTDTLPAGLSYVAASGSGWSCSSAGKEITCSHSGSLAVNATLALTLTVTVNGSGTQTNTASVAGQLFDNNSANNIASDSAMVMAPSMYAFTDAACVNGQAFGSAQQPCQQLAGAPVVAGEPAPVFVTALSDGVPAQLSASADTPVRMIFALSCINPATDAGVQANYAGVPLQLCTPNGAAPGSSSGQWSSFVDMVFKAGAPSVAANASFDYADVGKVQLYLRDTGSQIVASVPFVVKPAALALISVTRNVDGFSNPAPATAAGNNGFAKVGEAFTIKAAARIKSGATAPNFGNEGARLKLDWQNGGDPDALAAMVNPPTLSGDFSAIVGGVFTGSAFSVDEAGILAITPKLTGVNYLGEAVTSQATNVGRFYPDHFETSITAKTPLACLPHMGCPDIVIGAAAYSGQPFSVTVKAVNAAGGVVRNYAGALARPITLSAFSQAGGTAANPSGGSLTANIIAQGAIALDETIAAQPVYTLPAPFSNSAPRARNWTAPIPIYLRAGAEETGGVARVSSLRGATSVEGSATIISGRLALANPHGSELMKMPVRAEAQYWASTGRWETSATDSVSTVQSGGISFANCLKALGAPCKGALLGVTADTSLPLKNGVATFWLRAPGAGNYGSAEFQMNNPTWLPSTIGRAMFGVYKSPLIYMREVY
jgi:MSHA biogenesis protein MshQ